MNRLAWADVVFRRSGGAWFSQIQSSCFIQIRNEPIDIGDC